MPPDHADSFADTWAYLKTELRWLDQVLMLAVTRQRKETTEIERITHSKADRATSAWWKGIISTEGKAVYDEHRQPTATGAKVNYQQQLEGKIQASLKQGVGLGLPILRDRLGLTLFEKNLVLLSLAPEINRRYARLYRYLQGDDPALKTDLPTIDLVLRLLCRNDEEWRAARDRLVSTSPLLHYNLLQLDAAPADSWLNGSLKLAEPLVSYLLAEQPTRPDLERLLRRSQPQPLPLLQQTVLATEWSDLVLPEPLLASLQYLAQQLQGQRLACEKWGFQTVSAGIDPGKLVWLIGSSGTGKTIAAHAIARSLHTPLAQVDLAQLSPDQHPQLLQEILTKNPKILLLKSAHLWFGRSSCLSSSQIHQFLAKRQQDTSLTLLSTHSINRIQVVWRQQADQILTFAKPTPAERQRLWQQAFPAEIPLSPDLDWQTLAQNWSLTGKEILTIAQDAICYAAAIEAPTIEMSHILQALSQRGKRVNPQPALKPLPSPPPPAPPTETTAKRRSRRSTRTQATLTTPDLAQPEAVQPEAIQPEAASPELADPKLADPKLADPELAQPEDPQPELTQPKAEKSTKTSKSAKRTVKSTKKPDTP
ncbi:MAG TPA: AAA family ATPase [Allocoleopsis sp.]